MQRLSPYSQKFKTITVEGHVMVVPVVDDLDDDQLLEQLRHFIDRGDFEYCEHLAAECALRNIDVSEVFK